MSKTNLSLAETYYTAVGKKDIATAEKYLHPDVEFMGPLAKLSGKEAVLKATSNFAAAIENLTIRAKFASETQAMLVYETAFPAPIGKFSGASLLTIQDGLITNIELFYDTRRAESKKEEIFSQ